MTGAFEPRPYAVEAIRNLSTALPVHRRVLAVAPTGSGKTAIASQLIARTPRWRRVLWLAHRRELVDQAYLTLRGLGVEAGVMMASDERINGTARANAAARVIVASVQTVTARGVPDGVDLIVFDEAHRTMADSYQRIAEACPDADVLGLTATPIRLDGRGLGDFYTRIVVIAQPDELYAAGYLAKPTVYTSSPEVLAALASGMRGARTSRGDYTPASLSKAVDRKLLIGHVVSESQRLAPGVSKVVFACSVRHSQRIAADFRRAGVRAVHLDGKTPDADRDRMIRQLASGEIDVVCNVDVLSEGWDLPSLGAVVIARPTKSLGRFLQMAGRVQRVHGDTVPVVLDHGANCERFDFTPGSDRAWSLAGSNDQPDPDGIPRIKVCPACQACIPQACVTCPSCDDVQPRRPPTEREVIDAQLEERRQTTLAEQTARADAMAALANRSCECGCGDAMVRRENERAGQFARRRFMSIAHANAHANASRSTPIVDGRSCECGCGEVLVRHENEKPSEFAGRRFMSSAHAYASRSTPIVDGRSCECGCGDALVRRENELASKFARRRFMSIAHAYASRSTPIAEGRPCACGCGEVLVRRENELTSKFARRRFMSSAHANAHAHASRSTPIVEGRPCACGCGDALVRRENEPASKFARRRFMSNAHAHASRSTPIVEGRPCACGCGEVLVRHENEKPFEFARRRFMSNAHVNASRPTPKIAS